MINKMWTYYAEDKQRAYTAYRYCALNGLVGLSYEEKLVAFWTRVQQVEETP